MVRGVYPVTLSNACPLQLQHFDFLQIQERELKYNQSEIFFPLQPTHPHTDEPPARPTPKTLISAPFRLRFGPFRVRLAPFSSVWLLFGSVSGPLRVRFGVLGGVGVGSGKGPSVREKNITNLSKQTLELP